MCNQIQDIQMTTLKRSLTLEYESPSDYLNFVKASMYKKRKLAAQEAVKAVPVLSLSSPKKVDSSDSSNEETLMDETFQPGNWHVIYGREKIHKEHIGNKRLRVLIAQNLKSYVEAPTRREKSNIIDEVASQIRCYGGFVKKTEGGRWLSIGPVQAREKVGHSFRDCMKHFKGNKPESKQEQWTEAQNAIFANLNLTPASSVLKTTAAAPASPSATPPPRSVSPMRRLCKSVPRIDVILSRSRMSCQVLPT